MLHFDKTNLDQSTGGQADVVQLINMSPYATAIANGTATFSASAYFNRIAGDSNTDTWFRLVIRAYNGTPADYANSNGQLAETALVGSDLFLSDGNLATWEKLTAQLLLPNDTTFVILFLIAVEKNGGSVGFGGHYADLVSARITGPGINEVPLPAALPLFATGLGVLGLIGWRRKRKALALNVA